MARNSSGQQCIHVISLPLLYANSLQPSLLTNRFIIIKLKFLCIKPWQWCKMDRNIGFYHSYFLFHGPLIEKISQWVHENLPIVKKLNWNWSSISQINIPPIPRVLFMCVDKGRLRLLHWNWLCHDHQQVDKIWKNQCQVQSTQWLVCFTIFIPATATAESHQDAGRHEKRLGFCF